MLELEALAPDALYVNVVAALPEARGRGLGTRLLRLAEVIARDEGRPRLSLVVADANTGARRLYARPAFARSPPADGQGRLGRRRLRLDAARQGSGLTADGCGADSPVIAPTNRAKIAFPRDRKREGPSGRMTVEPSAAPTVPPPAEAAAGERGP